MKFRLLLVICSITIGLRAEVPTEVVAFVEDYQRLLQRNTNEAAVLRSSYTDAFISKERWIQAMDARSNEDMATKNEAYSIKADGQEFSYQGSTFYLLKGTYACTKELLREEYLSNKDLLNNLETQFKSLYGEDNVDRSSDGAFAIRAATEMIVVEGEVEGAYRIVDFPSGTLDGAYGSLPIAVWKHFFGDRALNDQLPLRPAVRLSFDRFTQLFAQGQYDQLDFMGEQQVFPLYDSLAKAGYKLDWQFKDLEFPGSVASTGDLRALAIRFGSELSMQLPEEMAAAEAEEWKKRLALYFDESQMTVSEDGTSIGIKMIQSAVCVADKKRNNWAVGVQDRNNKLAPMALLPEKLVTRLRL